MKKDVIKDVFYAICLLAIATFLVWGHIKVSKRQEAINRLIEGAEYVRIDTVRTVEHDTVRIEHPAPIASIALKPMLVRLPVYCDTAPINPINPIPPIDSINQDSALVEIPIEQKVFGDSTYRAVISGFMASLDTIEVYPRREVVTIREVIKPPARRWSIVAGVGYGITPRGMQPYAGITIGYRLY